MTQDQAAQLIAQNDQLLKLYGQFLPLLTAFVHEILPFAAVALSLWLGVSFGRMAVGA